MCGRFTQQASWAEVVEFMQPITVLAGETGIEPAYNIAPSQACWTLRPDAAGLQGLRMRWGLLPAWAKDTKLGYSTFNARAESMAEKPAFRSAFRHRRCLVPASGYYEWQTVGKAKQPYFVHAGSAPLLLFAALWEPAHPRLGELPSVSIVTREAEGAIRALHHRVPLILDPEQGAAWCREDAEGAIALAASAEPAQLAWHAVDRRVGNVREQGPELCSPVSRLL